MSGYNQSCELPPKRRQQQQLDEETHMMLSITAASLLRAAHTWPHWMAKATHACSRLSFEDPHGHLCAAKLDSIPTLGLYHSLRWLRGCYRFLTTISARDGSLKQGVGHSDPHTTPRATS